MRRFIAGEVGQPLAGGGVGAWSDGNQAMSCASRTVGAARSARLPLTEEIQGFKSLTVYAR